MRLLRFRVTNFRSVSDSGWIEADAVTALIGENESGKTNLLLPLWKLNPAREGEIAPTSDYPKSMFADVRADPGAFCFVTADFDTETSAGKLAEAADITEAEAATLRVSRYFDGRYQFEFSSYEREATDVSADLRSTMDAAADEIEGLSTPKAEAETKQKIVTTIRAAAYDVRRGEPLPAAKARAIAKRVRSSFPTPAGKASPSIRRTQRLADEIDEVAEGLSVPPPGEVEGVEAAILECLPKFVYYSNYGNLDSEIYLPHVVENLEREDLGAKEAAKARTLRVLFKFVTLEPDEILELGRDFVDPTGRGREPTQEEVTEVAEKKRERSILLQSAGTKLTKRFSEWWKQGDYRFRFEADGDHFRIWVADNRRPDEIELESRSTGLQWFLSFYLVFLVESEGDHTNAILLLDEPGLSLHPLAQRDLSAFFDNLSRTNQLLYTTHSPFLVHADRLERARKVYVAADGTTKATPDLRHGNDPRQLGAAYAVYSAINLNVSESLLLGCEPVIVEGASDQHYLTALKALLIHGGRLSPARELVFPPSGGTKNVRQVASILTGRDTTLPYVVIDGDEAGRRVAKELATSLYADAKDRLLCLDDFTGVQGSEGEDLFPPKFVAQAVDRIERRPDTAFSDIVQEGQPILGQIDKWIEAAGLHLKPDFKVELAKRVKQQALTDGVGHFDEARLQRWTRLFAAFGVKDHAAAS